MSSSLESIYEPGVVDPGVPVPNPTSPFWLSQPHPLANHQSPWPTDVVDVAIIGSGISGANLARTLLSKRPGLCVVLIEARSLCSGATARNGGHIKTMTFVVWEERKRLYGLEEAIRISEFELSHLESKRSAIQEAGIDCDFKEVEGIDAYYEQAAFDRAVKALEDMRTHAPHLANMHKVYTDKDTLHNKTNLSSGCIGAIGVPAASLWPYKMVTGILGKLIDSKELNVQTNTVVKDIRDNASDDFAIVRTSRGDIKAKHVVHATNGWLGHLLPELRPFISPVRGNVVRYQPADQNGHSPMGLDSNYSFWLRYAAKDYDYVIQREGGDIIAGRANKGRTTTSDDSATDSHSISHLCSFADIAVAAPVPETSSYVSHTWSGVLGFTEDALPFVGRLPFPGRSHQWVCGGYHAVGMIKAFRSAEMAALLILGEKLGEEYPKSMLLTEKRLKELQKSVEMHEKAKAKL